jgi:hypothetical protein
MDNRPRIQKVSDRFYLFFTILIILMPLYNIFFWMFINDLPENLITVNTAAKPLVNYELPLTIRFIGFLASLLPLSAMVYGIVNLRRIFALYKENIIFSYAHVECFRRSGIALILWMVAGIVYKSISGVLFTLGNPPGQRVLKVGFGSADFTALIIGLLILVISWVMEEGRKLEEDQALTI